MIYLDILFIYETKLRELENLCLLKYELDKRGYKSKILYVSDIENIIESVPKYSTNVLCVSSCYTNNNLIWEAQHYVKFQRVVDMQWENYGFEKDDNNENSYFNYSGIGKEVVHVSWGQINAERLHNVAHIDKSKIKVVGHVGMDFLRYPLSNYYLTRKELFAKYNIPNNRKVILYASSYYGDCYTDAFIDGMLKNLGDEWMECYKIMNDSQEIVLKWFERVCRCRDDIFIVFRPHPGFPYKKADELAKNCSNFKVILDESIKQWILACDSVYMGNSTSVVETFFAKKECHLLFPLELPKGFEMKLQEHSKRICDYDSFVKSIDEEETEFPVPVENIENAYSFDCKIPCYIRFADMVEEIMHDNNYKLSMHKKIKYNGYNIKQLLIRGLISIKPLYRMYLGMLSDNRIHISFITSQRKIRAEMYKSVYETVKERMVYEKVDDNGIDNIELRIAKAIERTV